LRVKEKGKMKRNNINKVLLLFVLIGVLVFWSCGKNEERVRLTLGGLIVPGKTSTTNAIPIKFIWQGGSISEVHEVMYDWSGHHLTLIPIGLEESDGTSGPGEFWDVYPLEINPLETGTYTIELIGDEVSYFDTIIVPMDAVDSIFRFGITVTSRSTGNPVSHYPITIGIHPLHTITPDTFLNDTTDSDGFVEFTYYSAVYDTIEYGLDIFSYPSSIAVKGVPEMMKIGLE
jgi:hypothetical protein